MPAAMSPSPPSASGAVLMPVEAIAERRSMSVAALAVPAPSTRDVVATAVISEARSVREAIRATS